MELLAAAFAALLLLLIVLFVQVMLPLLDANLVGARLHEVVKLGVGLLQGVGVLEPANEDGLVGSLDGTQEDGADGIADEEAHEGSQVCRKNTRERMSK